MTQESPPAWSPVFVSRSGRPGHGILRDAQLLAKCDFIATALILDPFLGFTTHKVKLGFTNLLLQHDRDTLTKLETDFRLDRKSQQFWDKVFRQPWFTNILKRNRIDEEQQGVLKELVFQYLNCFAEDSGFIIEKCSRFSSNKSEEAQICSTTTWEKGVIIKNLTAKCVSICRKAEETIVGLGKGDFILKIETERNSVFCLGPATFLNHSCSGHNAKLSSFDKKTGTISVKATKAIQVGEEITLFYDANYFKQCECEPCQRKQEKLELDKAFEVKEILAKRPVVDGSIDDVEYLVAWKGYRAAYNSWEPQAGLTLCSEAIEKFEKYQSSRKNPVQQRLSHNQSLPAPALEKVVAVRMKTGTKLADNRVQKIQRSQSLFNPLLRASTPNAGKINRNAPVKRTTAAVAAIARTRQIRNKKQYQRFWECATCGSKIASSKFHLKLHEAIHTGVRPFKCNQKGCNFSATQLGNLKTHQRIHTGQKPYKCSECNFTATQASHIRRHEGRFHDNCKTLLKKCEFCDFKTRENAHLKIHKMSHTGIKPYKCQVCNFSSAQAAEIRKHHQRDHEKNKSLMACRFCQFRTSKWMNLKLHVAIAHKQKEIFVNPKSSPKVVSELFKSFEGNRRRCSRSSAPKKRPLRKFKKKGNNNMNAVSAADSITPALIPFAMRFLDPVIALKRLKIFVL